MDFNLMWEAIPRIAEGVPITLLLAAAAIALGFVIALCSALSIITNRPVLGSIAKTYIYLFRSTPLLVQLFLIYYGLGQSTFIRESFLWPVLQSPMWCSIIALYQISLIKTHLMGHSCSPGRSGARRDAHASGKRRDALRRPAMPHRRPRSWARSPRRKALVVAGTTARFAPNERAQDRGEMSLYQRDLVLALNTGAFTAEIFRGAFAAVPVGQLEAAMAGGMSWWLSVRRILFPVGMRIALPSYGNELVMMVKATALASTVTVLEITGIAQKMISATYRPIEIFIVAGAFYLAMNLVLTRILKTIESRVSKHLQP